MYIDDAMNEGAYVPPTQPPRCKRGHSLRRDRQLTFDGGDDMVCARCGAVVTENINGGSDGNFGLSYQRA